SFKWSGHIAAGRMIRVRSLNGPITVAAANGDNVEVTATKRWRRGDPTVVHIDAKKYGAGDENVIICAVWGEDATCDERGYDSHNDSRRDPRLRNNDVSVEFHVLVPKGVNVAVNTVNGDVQVDGVTSDVDAGTVNGEVDIATSGGRARATKVNGGGRARARRPRRGGAKRDPTGTADSAGGVCGEPRSGAEP